MNRRVAGAEAIFLSVQFRGFFPVFVQRLQLDTLGFDRGLDLFHSPSVAEDMRLSQFVVQLLELTFPRNDIAFEILHLAVRKTTLAARLAGVPVAGVGFGRIWL